MVALLAPQLINVIPAKIKNANSVLLKEIVRSARLEWLLMKTKSAFLVDKVVRSAPSLRVAINVILATLI